MRLKILCDKKNLKKFWFLNESKQGLGKLLGPVQLGKTKAAVHSKNKKVFKILRHAPHA